MVGRKPRRQLLCEHLSQMLLEDNKTYIDAKIDVRASWLLIEGVRGTYTTRGICIVMGRLKEGLIKEINDTIRPYLTPQDYEKLIDFIIDTVDTRTNLLKEQLEGLR